MTDQSVVEAEEEPEADEIEYESIVERYEFNGDVYYFTNDIDACMTQITEADDNYCIVLANESVSATVAGKLEISHRPRMFQYSKTIAGITLVVMDDAVDSLDVTKEQAYFMLPKMPMTFVRDIDTLFHAVEDKHGSEAIVLLTYDPNFQDSENPGEGWGFLVPEQENTSGHCRYKAESVEGERPEDVYIVGSAHSHPKMSAFASHTDEGDQLNFDGIHITFGWQRNQPTEYHIEWQMGGTQFPFTPDQLFESYLDHGVDADKVKEWMKPIKKSYGGSTAPGKATGSQSGTNGKSTATGTVYSAGPKKELPPGIPPESPVVIRMLDQSNKQCPACRNYLIDAERHSRRCTKCMSYLMYEGDTVKEIITIRAERGMDSPSLRDGTQIYIWERSHKGNTYEERIETIPSFKDMVMPPKSLGPATPATP